MFSGLLNKHYKNLRGLLSEHRMVTRLKGVPVFFFLHGIRLKAEIRLYESESF